MSSTTDHSPPHIHNVLLTLPRTASNLLTHILNLPSQSSIKSHPKSGYHFLTPFIYRYTHGLIGKAVKDWSEEEKDEVRKMLQGAFNEWMDWMRDSEKEGKGSYLKEHLCFIIEPDFQSQAEHSPTKPTLSKLPSHSPFILSMNEISETEGKPSAETPKPNPTIFPSAFWLNKVRPTFLIRHPALAFPSFLRTALDTQNTLNTPPSSLITKSECSYHFHRTLFQFYASTPTFDQNSFTEGVQYPIILDSDDFSEPAILRKYAAAVGLDPDLIRFSWEAATPAELEDMPAMQKRFLDSLLASSGVDPKKLRKVSDIVLEDEKKKWEKDFGEEWANRLEELVKDAMPDYEWLREKRLKL